MVRSSPSDADTSNAEVKNCSASRLANAAEAPLGGRAPLRHSEPRVSGGGGVAGGGFGVVVEQRDEAAVANDTQRLRRGVVEDLADEVVGELVTVPGLDDDASPACRLGPLDDRFGGDADQFTEQGHVEGRTDHDRGAQHLLDVGPTAANSCGDRVA